MLFLNPRSVWYDGQVNLSFGRKFECWGKEDEMSIIFCVVVKKCADGGQERVSLYLFISNSFRF